MRVWQFIYNIKILKVSVCLFVYLYVQAGGGPGGVRGESEGVRGGPGGGLGGFECDPRGGPSV